MTTFSKNDSFLETLLLLSIIHREIFNLEENFSKTLHKIAKVSLAHFRNINFIGREGLNLEEEWVEIWGQSGKEAMFFHKHP